MQYDSRMNSPTHGQAHANAVLAVLALLTESCVSGVVRADTPFRPDTHPGRAALLEAATAIQTEVSLSIVASDPLIAEAARGLASATTGRGEDARENAVIEVDRVLQHWVSLLEGRGQQLDDIADLISKRGEVSLEEIAALLHSTIVPKKA